MSILGTQRACRGFVGSVAGLVIASASFAGSSPDSDAGRAGPQPEIRFPLFVADPKPEPLGPDVVSPSPPPDRRVPEDTHSIAAADDKSDAHLNLRQ